MIQTVSMAVEHDESNGLKIRFGVQSAAGINRNPRAWEIGLFLTCIYDCCFLK
jgi:hypothetical protein